MDRSSASRLLLIVGVGLALFLLFQSFFGDEEGDAVKTFDSEVPAAWRLPAERAPEQLCTLKSDRFEAELSSRGAGLKHLRLLSDKYVREGKAYDVVTTSSDQAELYRQLRFGWRNPAVAGAEDPSWNVAFDSLDWQVSQPDPRSCEFRYRDEQVELTKLVKLNDRPYELEVTGTIKNLAAEKKKHALVIQTPGWRFDAELESSMFRVNPLMTHVECIDAEGAAIRKTPDDFDPGDYDDPAFARGPLNNGEWFQSSSSAVVAVSNFYFSHALVPLAAPEPPVCQLRVERWGANEANAGNMYRARLAYPPRELAKDETASYSVLSYVGPMERSVLDAAGGGDKNLSELVDLGFFAVIAKFLVAFLLKVHSLVPNWGFAIIILTVCARTLLFPLSIPMIRNSMKMKELKPEMDALNEKYKDDAQAKGLAQMELWRKHNVNPLKGCLPQMASMPVWFALYTTLQRSVELYNIPFLWFPDLSESDPYFVLPFVIGATYYVQQLLMPPQGDPAQQKMMRYFMPGMFTVFMLFLPAGLGVYMFTNSVLGILQQQAVEWHIRRKANQGSIQVKDTPPQSGGAGQSKRKKPGKPPSGWGPPDESDKPKGSKKKSGKTDPEFTESRPLLDKGKA